MKTIFKALNEVQTELSKLGIGKNQRNTFDKYNYRGIDDVLNSLAPILSKAGVLIFPSVKEKEIRQVQTAKGGSMNFATLRVDYTLYDSEGDSITHTVYGEAMDRGDKSINKAMTAAYKYFLFQAFCIPLVGNDADSESHEIAEEKTITAEQCKRLTSALIKAGMSAEEFCSAGRLNSIAEMPESRFERSMEFINSRVAA